MTQIFTLIKKWRDFRKQLPVNQTIGFVATMGNLHVGHRALLERSLKENAITVLSIFVNPTQFNDKSDFTAYPKTFDQDFALADELNVDFIFSPEYSELYSNDYRYVITEKEVSRLMEGAYRPGHFDGVLTVVMKLLMLVKPSKAYFGEKDFQQLQLVKGLVDAFFVDTEIISCPIIRHDSGLALSSRNNLLTPEQYLLAQRFPKLLALNTSLLEIRQRLEEEGFIVDYIEEWNNRRCGAVKIGNIHLIDNIPLEKCKTRI